MIRTRILLAVLLSIALAACGGAPKSPKSAASSGGYGRLVKEEVYAGVPASAKAGSADFAPMDAMPAASPEPPPPPPPEAAPVLVDAARNDPTAALPPGWQPPAQNGPTTTAKPQVANDGVESGQMLIYTANLTMAVYQVEQGLSAVERIAHEHGGYLAARTDRAITIRVPRAQFEKALKTIEPAGEVLHREVKAEDVTDEFFDLEVRLRNARAMRDRLAKLLQQAVVKEALDIEKELSRVTEEIERIEGKLKLFRHRIAYSTIHVTFQPRGVAVETRPLRLPFQWLDQLGLPTLLQLEDK